MCKKKRIDWHAGFVSAMKLELMDNEEVLEFHDENTIEHNRQRFDLLIIKKNRSVSIQDEIGALLRTRNIIEYKSPGARLDAEEFYKTLGYVSRYIYEEHDHDKYPAEDYTMMFLRESIPRDMICSLGKDGIHFGKECSPGIYEINGCIPFKAWLIVTGKLGKDHVWLRALTRSGDRKIIDEVIRKTPEKDDIHKDYVDCVMNVFARANSSLFKTVKEEESNMCEAIEELFADQIEMLTNKAESYKKEAEASRQEAEASRQEAEASKKLVEEYKAKLEAANEKLLAAGLV